MEAGTDVEVNVTFPEEYHAEDLKGKAAVFKCKVHEIKAKELPEIDDEFAAEVSEFDTLEEYKADLKAKLSETKQKQATTENENNVLEKVVANASMEIPEAMLETQIDTMMNQFANQIAQQGLSLEQYMQYLSDHGVGEDELQYMTHDIQAGLLGIE